MRKWRYAAAALGLTMLLTAGCQDPTPTEPTTLPTTEPTTVQTTEPTTMPTTQPVLTGWQELDGNRYYYAGDGTMVTGWQELEDGLYYFDGEGVMFVGWLITEDATYYLNEDGTAQTGWTVLGEGTYYFREDGVMHTGWLDEHEARYYFQENGVMARGWMELDGARYFFRDDGAVHTGWLSLGEYDYYFEDDGTAAVGPTEIEGQTRYFSPSGVHIILVNPWNYLPDDYETELVTTERDLKVSVLCIDALEQMLADCRAAGCDAVLLSANRTMETQRRLYDNKVQTYLDKGYDRETAKAIAGQIVAVPGTSEHHLGLAVDIVDDSNWKLNESQERTETNQWLREHCWEYGFILRYPNGTTEITGIIYESWHFRYVGVEIALELRDLGITLEEYLGAA